MQAHVMPWNLGEPGRPWVTLDLMFMEMHASLCNYMQAQGTSCMLIWNCMQGHGNAFPLLELHASSLKCLQLMELHATLGYLG